MTKTTQSRQNDNTNVNLAVIATDINYIKADVKEIKTKLEIDYVERKEFDPVKKIVYGMITIVTTGVLGAILTLVLRKQW